MSIKQGVELWESQQNVCKSYKLVYGLNMC
jgi:hypothetical protein